MGIIEKNKKVSWKRKSIITRTYISAGTGHKVSQISTTNDYLILYLLGKLHGEEKNGTVIDIDRENKTILIKKNAEWKVISEDLDGFTEQILKTDEDWCKDVAKKL
jgi:hypothetical protein